ncbi:MAG: hypothetical protein BGO12_20065 [Verrucomicrobia bacterium 61-8]|nr:hypothetical protein [Verrucomicrobiota bacterium]OJU98681.1 MAG: hypothetical protein BGO12_20065 [Verrucomicrobia bacterium 61-8]
MERNTCQQLDQVLLQQVEELCSGENVHLHANLAAAYRSSIEQYRLTGDEEFQAIATDAYVELRILLTKLRQQRAAFIRWE